MIQTSPVLTDAPKEFRTELQRDIYRTLSELGIPYSRTDCDPCLTMEDCAAIDARLEAHTIKTLLLCNRQQTQYYLFIMKGDKPFITKDFGKALGISRVSFAPAEKLLEMLGTVVGATTALSLIRDPEHQIRLVIDEDVLQDPWFCGTDGTTTCYMRFATRDLLEKFIPHIGHQPSVITV